MMCAKICVSESQATMKSGSATQGEGPFTPSISTNDRSPDTPSTPANRNPGRTDTPTTPTNERVPMSGDEENFDPGTVDIGTSISYNNLPRCADMLRRRVVEIQGLARPQHVL